MLLLERSRLLSEGATLARSPGDPSAEKLEREGSGIHRAALEGLDQAEEGKNAIGPQASSSFPFSLPFLLQSFPLVASPQAMPTMWTELKSRGTTMT